MNSDNQLSEPSIFDETTTYDPNWGDGQIHLKGGFDFPIDREPEQTINSLKDRAEEIGGLIKTSDGSFTVHNNGQKFRVFHQDGDYTRFKTWNDKGQLIQDDTREEVVQQGEKTAEIVQQINEAAAE